MVIYPLLEWLFYSSIERFMRCRDRSWTYDERKSQQVNFKGYVDLYSGAFFYINFRYSALLTLSGLAFLYGTTMPILYPIALAAFIVLWVLDRILIAYYYREPPSYSV